jgi:hypothetical protein
MIDKRSAAEKRCGWTGEPLRPRDIAAPLRAAPDLVSARDAGAD